MVSVEEQLFFNNIFVEPFELDPNNIPIFKFFFSDSFFIEKQCPRANRSQNALAFEQIQITCLLKAKASARHLCWLRLGFFSVS